MSGELEPMPRAELRASHEDRDAVVDRLRIAAGDGRIDHDELDQRIEAAMTARTYGELDVIVKDLPQSPEAAARTVARRAEVVESQTVTVAHGKAEKYGPWLVPQKLFITARHGVVILDFTDAVFSGAREIEIELDVRHSAIRLISPEGTIIDEDVLDRRHSNVRRRHLGAPGPESVRIRLTGRMAHSSVGARRMSLRRRRLRERRELRGR
jgi:hypothetical protein